VGAFSVPGELAKTASEILRRELYHPSEPFLFGEWKG